MTSDRPRLRIALVGTGNWSSQHARYLAGNPDVEFVAISGRTRETVDSRAQKYGTRGYTDLPAMLEAERPDLVVLSLPNQLHVAPAMTVIEAGIPLIVEKPLAFDLDEAETIVAEAARRDLFFAIDFNHRYARPVEKAKAAIEAGALGDIVFASWRFGGEGSSTHPHANLIETQCHAFDMLEHLVGPISSVMAEMTDMTGKGYSTVSLALRFAQGAVGSIVGSHDASYADPDTHRLEINGTKGRVVVGDTVQSFQFQVAGSETAEVWQAGYFNDRDRDFHQTLDRHMDAILDAFRRGEEPPVHARAGVRALELAHATIRSYDEGRRIDTIPGLA